VSKFVRPLQINGPLHTSGNDYGSKTLKGDHDSVFKIVFLAIEAAIKKNGLCQYEIDHKQ